MVMLLSATLLTSIQFLPAVNASSTSTGEGEPRELFFHYTETPVGVAGLETKYIMNATRSFGFLTQGEAYANSFYKPPGLPKIAVSFYLYPNLEDPVTIEGNWQILIWVNSSAYRPVTFALQFKEITMGGVELWASGQITPTVTSTIGSYINVPPNGYNLSTPLTHTFNADSTILVSVEVNTGSVGDSRIWYDSPLYSSKAILPVTDSATDSAGNPIWSTTGFLLLVIAATAALATIVYLYKRGKRGKIIKIKT
jgi:hypothetical protein